MIYEKHIINCKNFQIVQDDIAEATDIAIITVDYSGKPITQHSKCSEFCKLIRQDPIYNMLCEKCDSRGALEAARLKAPYIYRCHAGLVDFAVPIIVGKSYLGAVMAGQVLLPDTDQEKLEYIVNEKQFSLDLSGEKDLKKLFKTLPVMTLKKVEAISRMILHLSNYIVEESILNTSFKDFNQYNQRETFQGNINVNINEEIKRQEIGNPKKEKLYVNNSIIRPALEYIEENYSENITLKKMGSLCNISTSYFSKIFKRETKKTLPYYVNEIRIERGKELLENSNMPIINISLDLGFSDCGYFIKVFKNLQGITPDAYRKKFNNMD